MQRSLLIFATLIVSCAQVASSDEIENQKALTGTWLAEKAQLGGQPFPEDARKSIKLTLDGDKYMATVGTNTDQGTFKLNTAKKPWTMDITGTEGPNKGKTIPAIYALAGDMLTVCYDLSAAGHPKEFESTNGTLYFLVTYKRAKP